MLRDLFFPEKGPGKKIDDIEDRGDVSFVLTFCYVPFRFYSAMVDSELLEKGTKYSELPNT